MLHLYAHRDASIQMCDNSIVCYKYVNLGDADVNHSNAELNPICHLVVLLGAHHILHVSGLRLSVALDGCALSRMYLSQVTTSSP